MRLKCKLRELRGDRPLRQVEAETSIARGTLSRYETGQQVPPDRHIPALERAYRAPWPEWYAPHVVIELTPDPERKA